MTNKVNMLRFETETLPPISVLWYVFFWCRNEQFQEELWKITLDSLKTFLSLNILEKYGPAQTTTHQPEMAEEATGNVRVDVEREKRRVRGQWQRGIDRYTCSCLVWFPYHVDEIWELDSWEMLSYTMCMYAESGPGDQSTQEEREAEKKPPSDWLD